MSSFLVPASGLSPEPWPNGRGVTRTIHRVSCPDGSQDWSLSLADLREPAPFSHLPGLDRIFTIVEGQGVILSFADGEIDCPPLVPIHFPGEAAPGSRLRAGPGRAFNLMSARGRWRADVRAAGLPPGGSLDPGRSTAIHVVRGRALMDGRDLGPGDTWVGPGETLRAGPDGAMLLLVVLDPLSAPAEQEIERLEETGTVGGGEG